MSKLCVTRQQVKEYTQKLCIQNKFPATFFSQFWEGMLKRDDIYKEYVWYLVKKEFLNKVNISGYHVVDVFVWQMDHFKANLDQDTYDMKHNEAKMILTAFDTFLKMGEEPEYYIHQMQTQTGTDYAGKYI